MKKKVLSVLKFGVFLAIGGLLLWLAVRGQDFTQLRKNISEAAIIWVVLSAVLGLISHVSRAVRWKLLIQPLGFKTRLPNVFMAVMSGYLANLAFPRLGEVSKCAVLKKYEGVPINKLLGTMIIERAMDILLLAAMTILLFILEFDLIADLLLGMVSTKVDNSDPSSASMWWVVALVGGVILLAIVAWRLIRKTAFGLKLSNLFEGFKEGLKTIGQLEHKWWFIFHSIAIWVLYYAMSYVVLFAFDATAHLGLVAGLAVLVMGSLGMIAPVQGGIGAYHFMAKETLMVYGIAEASALAFAFVIHGGQTIMVLTAGFISVILLPVYNRNNGSPLTDTAENFSDQTTPTKDSYVAPEK